MNINEVLNIFTPYIFVFSLLVSVTLNLIAIFKGVNWITLLILNIIVSALFQLTGLQSFDVLTIIVEYLIGLLQTIIDFIMDLIWSPIDRLIEGIGNLLPW